MSSEFRGMFASGGARARRIAVGRRAMGDDIGDDMSDETVEEPAKAQAIAFYGTRQAYGEFSNFAPSALDLDGLRWPTAEHYFQAQKFAGTPHAEAIRQARSPMIAARMGRSRTRPLRADW